MHYLIILSCFFFLGNTNLAVHHKALYYNKMFLNLELMSSLWSPFISIISMSQNYEKISIAWSFFFIFRFINNRFKFLYDELPMNYQLLFLKVFKVTSCNNYETTMPSLENKNILLCFVACSRRVGYRGRPCMLKLTLGFAEKHSFRLSLKLW